MEKEEEEEVKDAGKVKTQSLISFMTTAAARSCDLYATWMQRIGSVLKTLLVGPQDMQMDRELLVDGQGRTGTAEAAEAATPMNILYVDSKGSRWSKLLQFIGPGYMIAVGYMDPVRCLDCCLDVIYCGLFSI